MLNDDDPGWPIKTELLPTLVPVGGVLVRRRLAKSTNGLVALRQVFMSLTVALVLFGVVLAFLWPAQSTKSG